MRPSARDRKAGVIGLGTKTVLPVIHETAAAMGHLTRREVVRRLLAGMGAGAAWALVAASHPIHEILKNDALLEEKEKLGGGGWKPVLLNSQQNERLIAIADENLPGLMNGQVTRFLDLRGNA